MKPDDAHTILARVDFYPDGNEVLLATGVDVEKDLLQHLSDLAPRCDVQMQQGYRPSAYVMKDGTVIDESMGAFWFGPERANELLLEFRVKQAQKPAAFLFLGYIQTILTDRGVEFPAPEKFLLWLKRRGEESLPDGVRTAIHRLRIPGDKSDLFAQFDAYIDEYAAWLKARGPESEHTGVLDTRQEFDVRCEWKSEPIEGEYGSANLYKFGTGPSFKDKLIWFTGSDFDWWVEGKIVRIVGRVTEHSEYQGEKQTKLTRVKLAKGE
jgi:hypothetical protein